MELISIEGIIIKVKKGDPVLDSPYFQCANNGMDTQLEFDFLDCIINRRQTSNIEYARKAAVLGFYDQAKEMYSKLIDAESIDIDHPDSKLDAGAIVTLFKITELPEKYAVRIMDLDNADIPELVKCGYIGCLNKLFVQNKKQQVIRAIATHATKEIVEQFFDLVPPGPLLYYFVSAGNVMMAKHLVDMGVAFHKKKMTKCVVKSCSIEMMEYSETLGIKILPSMFNFFQNITTQSERCVLLKFLCQKFPDHESLVFENVPSCVIYDFELLQLLIEKGAKTTYGWQKNNSISKLLNLPVIQYLESSDCQIDYHDQLMGAIIKSDHELFEHIISTGKSNLDRLVGYYIYALSYKKNDEYFGPGDPIDRKALKRAIMMASHLDTPNAIERMTQKGFACPLVKESLYHYLRCTKLNPIDNLQEIFKKSAWWFGDIRPKTPIRPGPQNEMAVNVRRGKLDKVKHLVSLGSKIDFGCLKIALDYNYKHYDMFKYLVNYWMPKKKINRLAKNQIETLYYRFVKNNDLEMVRRTHERFKWYSESSFCRRTFKLGLSFSCKMGYLQLVKYFMESGIKINGRQVVTICINGHVDILEYVVRVNPKILKNKIILPGACDAGKLRIVKYLVAMGVEITDHAVLCACNKNAIFVLEYLLSQGAQVDKKMLIKICEMGEKDVAKYLIHRGIEIDDDIMQAGCHSGHKGLVKMLMSLGGHMAHHLVAEFYIHCGRFEKFTQPGVPIFSERRNLSTFNYYLSKTKFTKYLIRHYPELLRDNVEAITVIMKQHGHRLLEKIIRKIGMPKFIDQHVINTYFVSGDIAMIRSLIPEVKFLFPQAVLLAFQYNCYDIIRYFISLDDSIARNVEYFKEACKIIVGNNRLLAFMMKSNKNNLEMICQGFLSAASVGNLRTIKYLREFVSESLIAQAFLIACGTKYVEVVDYLAHQVDIQMHDNIALRTAVCHREFETAAELVQLGARWDKALMFSIKTGALETVQMLCEFKGPDCYYFQVVLPAINYGQAGIVKFCLQNFVLDNDIIKIALISACNTANMEIIDIVMDKYNTPNQDLILAHQKRLPGVMCYMLRNKKAKALADAYMNGDLEFIEYLYQKAYQDFVKDWSIVCQSAISSGRVEMVEFLAKNGGATLGVDAFNFALKNGHSSVVDFLFQLTHPTLEDLPSDIFLEVSREGHKACLEYLLRKYGNVVDLNKCLTETCKQSCIDKQTACLQTIEYLIFLGADPKFHDNEPIILAGESGQISIIKYLVSIGADPRARYDRLMLNACRKGDIGLVEYLVEIGVEATIRDNEPLFSACMSGNLELVKYLCDHGASPKARRETVLSTAIFLRHLSIIEYLVSRGLNVNGIDEYPLIIACSIQYFDAAQFLLSHGASVNVKGGEPLMIAIRNNDFYMVSLLIEHDANDETIDSAFSMASNLHGVKMLKHLASHDINLRLSTNGSIIKAINQRDYEKIEYMLGEPKIFCRGAEEIVHRAMKTADTKIIELVFGALTPKKNDHFLASAIGSKMDMRIVKLLTKKYTNQKGMRDGLRMAVHLGDLAIIEYLVSKNASIVDDQAKLLFFSSKLENPATTIYLIQQGVDINVDESQALFNSCRRGLDIQACVLISHNADIRAKNYAAFIAAVRKCHVQTVQHFIMAGMGAKQEDIMILKNALVEARKRRRIAVINYLISQGVE